MEKEREILLKVDSLFMRYGIKSVTMDDISRELGISKKTLYQYVENKSDLINKVIQEHLISEKEIISKICKESIDPIDEMLAIARYVALMLREMNPSIVYDLQKYYSKSWEMMQSLHEDHIYEVIKRNIQKGIEEGLYRQNLNPEIIAKFYVGKSMILVDERIFPIRKYNREQLFLEFINYHIHGIASEKGLALLEKRMRENK